MAPAFTTHKIIRYVSDEGRWEVEIDLESRAQKVPGGLKISGPNHEPYCLAARDAARTKPWPKP